MRKDERGAVLVLFALCATALILMTGLAANIGMMYSQRTRMQAAADAAALAGACALDFGDQAGSDAAKLYAQQNGFPLQASEVSILNNSRVTVHLARPMDFYFANFLQNKSALIGATASADFKPISRGVRPIGVPSQVFQQNTLYTIKYGGGGGGKGNFQALALGDSQGASAFERSFKYGSDQPCCSPSTVFTEPGNMAGPTESAAAYLLDRKPQATYREVLEETRADSSEIEKYPKVITVLVVKDFDVNGRKPVNVVGFARFYLDSVNKGEVRAYFIDECLSVSQKDRTKYHSRLVQ